MRHQGRLCAGFQLRHLMLLGALLLAPSAHAQGDPMRLLVMPWTLGQEVPLDAAAADAILGARMGKIPLFNVVTQNDLSAMAEHQMNLQQLGADTGMESLLALGRQAQAQKLISGTLERLGDTVVSTLVLLDVVQGKVEKRVAGTAMGRQDLIIPLLNRQADALAAYLIRTYSPQALGSARAPAPPAKGTSEAATAAPERAAPVPAVTGAPGLAPRLWGLLAGLGGVGLGAVGTGVLAASAVALTLHTTTVPATSENNTFRLMLVPGLVVGAAGALVGGAIMVGGVLLWLLLPGGTA